MRLLQYESYSANMIFCSSVSCGKVKIHERIDQNLGKVLSQDDIIFESIAILVTAAAGFLKCMHGILFKVILFQAEK